MKRNSWQKRTRTEQVHHEVLHRQSILSDPYQNAWKHFANPKEKKQDIWAAYIRLWTRRLIKEPWYISKDQRTIKTDP